MTRSGFLAGISPFTFDSTFLQGIDIVSILLLTYTGIVAPYEVRPGPVKVACSSLTYKRLLSTQVAFSVPNYEVKGVEKDPVFILDRIVVSGSSRRCTGGRLTGTAGVPRTQRSHLTSYAISFVQLVARECIGN